MLTGDRLSTCFFHQGAPGRGRIVLTRNACNAEMGKILSQSRLHEHSLFSRSVSRGSAVGWFLVLLLVCGAGAGYYLYQDNLAKRKAAQELTAERKLKEKKAREAAEKQRIKREREIREKKEKERLAAQKAYEEAQEEKARQAAEAARKLQEQAEREEREKGEGGAGTART